MRTYWLVIKSHCEAPDFDHEVEAKNKKEAIRMFLEMLGPEWDNSMIKNMVREVKNGYLYDDELSLQLALEKGKERG